MLVLVVGLVAYMLGHVLDSLAKLLIDRVLIYKGYGYPYQELFGLSTSRQSDENKRIAKGIGAAVEKDC